MRLVRYSTPEGEPVVVAAAHVVMLRPGADEQHSCHEDEPTTLIYTTGLVSMNGVIMPAYARVLGTVGAVADALVGVPPTKDPPPPREVEVIPGLGDHVQRVRVCGPCKLPIECWAAAKCLRGTREYEHLGET